MPGSASRIITTRHACLPADLSDFDTHVVPTIVIYIYGSEYIPPHAYDPPGMRYEFFLLVWALANRRSVQACTGTRSQTL